VWSFESGLQTLPDELACWLKSTKNVDIRTETRCTKLQFTQDKIKVVYMCSNFEFIIIVISFVQSSNRNVK